MLHYTLSFFSRSLNFLSPLIATLGTRFIIACAPNCILNQQCCTNMIKRDIYHRYMLLFYFFYSSNTHTHTHRGVQMVIHNMTPHQSAVSLSVCPPLTPPSFLLSLLLPHTYTALCTHADTHTRTHTASAHSNTHLYPPHIQTNISGKHRA